MFAMLLFVCLQEEAERPAFDFGKVSRRNTTLARMLDELDSGALKFRSNKGNLNRSERYDAHKKHFASVPPRVCKFELKVTSVDRKDTGVILFGRPDYRKGWLLPGKQYSDSGSWARAANFHHYLTYPDGPSKIGGIPIAIGPTIHIQAGRRLTVEVVVSVGETQELPKGGLSSTARRTKLGRHKDENAIWFGNKEWNYLVPIFFEATRVRINGKWHHGSDQSKEAIEFWGKKTRPKTG